MNVNKLLISTILIVIGLSFMPLIGSLVLTASTTIEEETIVIVVPFNNRFVDLNQKQYAAITHVKNGTAKSLKYDVGSGQNPTLVYNIINNYEFVDPNYDIRTFTGAWEVFHEPSDRTFFRVAESTSTGVLLEWSLYDGGFPYLSQTIPITGSDSIFFLRLEIEFETSTSNLNNLITIVAVLITTSAILVYLKFR